MSTLTELNALRVAKGMKPLKAWKESKDKLAAAVKKLAALSSTETQLAVSAVAGDEVKPAATKSKVTTSKPAKSTTKVLKPAKAAKKSTVEGVSVSTIAAKLGIDPKVARAKLRRSFGDADGTGSDGRWVFTEAKVKEIEAILKGDARKKA